MGHTRDTNNKDNNIIYINLLNKYKERMKNARYFPDKIHIQSELKKDMGKVIYKIKQQR